MAGAAEEAVIGDAERPAGRGQLADPMVAEAAVGIPGQVRECGRYDLAQLPQGAGDERHLRALGRVFGHRGAGANGLVVRMRVDQQQAPGVRFAHIREPTDCQRRQAGRIDP